jgi:hypothetical protein
MAKQFVKWVKRTVSNVLDSEREERVKKLSTHLYKGLRAERKKFKLAKCLRGLEVADGELQEAKESVFIRIMDKVWDDGVLTDKERETVDFVQRGLELTQSESSSIRQRYASKQFQVSLAKAMEDGVLSDDELAHLEHISESVGQNVATYTRTFFRTQGEGFVRGMFLACIEEGQLTADEWNKFISTGRRLGLEEHELQKLISKPAKKYVEHVLADAKADEKLSPDEKQELDWLLEILHLDDEFASYVQDEMQFLHAQYEISQGRLPSLQRPRNLEVRGGEIVHASFDAVLVIVRNLKSGTRKNEYSGRITLLDSRAIFQGEEKSEAIRYRRIVSVRGGINWAEFQLTGKPVWAIHFDDDPLAFPIFSKAVALANQTAVRKNEDGPSRHIPREVRQRVWQRYGGQCAECSATDYLEFDHIIPHAKGGGNGDNNIQLLCRKCNLKKSDHI